MTRAGNQAENPCVVRVASPRALRVVLAVSVVAALVCPIPTTLFAAEESVEITGTILDPDGRPADGFRIVLEDLIDGSTYTSDPSGTDGSYTISVPVGGRYTLSAVLSPEGEPLPVQTIPPITLDQAGTRRLDVAFQRQSPSSRVSRDRDDRLAVPWYKTGWGITAIVVGVGGVAALALGGGGKDNPPASPSSP